MDRQFRFDKAVTPVPVDPDTGEPKPVYAEAYSCWGKWMPLNATERFIVQQPLAQQTRRAVIRWPGQFVVTPGEELRLIDISDYERVYDIQGVAEWRPKEISRRRFMEITAVARGEAMVAA